MTISKKTRLRVSVTPLILPLLFVSPGLSAGQKHGGGASAFTNSSQTTMRTDQIIVKYKNSSPLVTAPSLSATAMNSISTRAGTSLKHVRRSSVGGQVMKLNRRASLAELQSIAANLMTDPEIEYAEPDMIMVPLFTPNDSRYNEQWQYFDPAGGLNLPTAWDTTQGLGAVVAVVDTGYLPHADLADNLLPGYDMIFDTFVSRDGNGRDADASDPGDWTNAGDCFAGSPAETSSWHGTHVAGSVAAVSNNGTGVAGVAFQAKVVPVRALGRCGGYTSDIADGIIWAAGGNVNGVPTNPNPANVINLSLGGLGTCGNTTQNAINTARGLGATVVVAAGNSNTDASSDSPANCAGVITVAATTRSGGKAFYSNFGTVVDVAAPGGDTTNGEADGILSTSNTGLTSPSADSYTSYQGTSMAAPHVSGVAALLYALDTNITPDQVESNLTSTARAFPATCSQCGAGIVDAAAAVAALGGGGGDGGGDGGGGIDDTILTNGVAKTDLAGAQAEDLHYTMDVPAGASNLQFQISGGTGDADIYVRFGAAPTTTTYDCRPFINGNVENCSFTTTQAGTYYVMVRGYRSFSGVSLTGSFTEPSSGGDAPEGGLNEPSVSGSWRTWTRFTLDVPAGMSAMDVVISGGRGDADLYVRFGATPTSRRFNCRPFLNGNEETCSISNPTAGTWHISLYGYNSFSNVSLNAQYR